VGELVLGLLVFELERDYIDVRADSCGQLSAHIHLVSCLNFTINRGLLVIVLAVRF